MTPQDRIAALVQKWREEENETLRMSAMRPDAERLVAIGKRSALLGRAMDLEK